VVACGICASKTDTLMLKPIGEGNTDYLKVTECTGKR
jgi:hypothetical protein